MAQAGVLQVFVDALVVVFGGRLVLGVVSLDCFPFDELPSLVDLLFSTAYREINTTNRMISTRNKATKRMRAFKGFRVSVSSSKRKELDDAIF